jgi:hypothetical protein
VRASGTPAYTIGPVGGPEFAACSAEGYWNVPYGRCYFCDAPILPDDATTTVARLYLTVHLACYERDLAATLVTSKAVRSIESASGRSHAA